MSTTENAQIGQLELEIEVEAEPQRAWNALTQEIDRWWLPDFRATGEQSVVRLDLRAGGALTEVGPDGTELLWYTVQMVQPGSTLYLVGHTAADWGGPCVSMLKLALTPRGNGSLLTIHDSLLGKTSATQVAAIRDGWHNLFGNGYKAHLDGG